MDRFQYKKQCIKLAWLAGAGYLILVIFLLAGVLKSQAQKLKSIKNEIKVLNIKNRYFGDFKNIVEESKSQRKVIKDIIENFRTNLMPGDKIEQGFLEEIGRITKATNIKIENINITPIGASSKSERGYEKPVWMFNFFADYKKIVKFVNLLENSPIFFGIDKLDITSGNEKPSHGVSMSIYTVIPLARDSKSVKLYYNVLDSTGVFNLPEDSLNMANSILRKKEESVATTEIKKDPMYFGNTIFPEKKKKRVTVKKKKSMPELTLGGIIWDSQNPMAIINGKVLSTGDVIEGVKVVKIMETSITVQWNKRRYKLKLKEGE